MIRSAWIHDHKFYCDAQGHVYSETGVNRQGLTKYLSYFDELLVLGRKAPTAITGTEAVSLCSGPQTQFDLYGSSDARDFYLRPLALWRYVKTALQSVDCAFIMLPSYLGLIAAQACERLGKPYVIQVVGCAWDAYWHHGAVKAKVLAAPFFLATRFVVGRAKYVTYVTEKFLQARYPTQGIRGDAIPNAAVSMRPDVKNSRLHHLCSRRVQDEFRVGLIGSLDVDYKGHAMAIRALARLRSEGVDASLHLVGPGSAARWFDFAKGLGIDSNVVAHGTLPGGSPVLHWLDEIDAYIQPSLAEGHGRAVVEAMSRGCPTFATQVGGLSDSLPVDHLVRKRDYRKLAALLYRTAVDRDYAVAASEKCYQAAARFEANAVAHKRNLFFEQFLAAEGFAR